MAIGPMSAFLDTLRRAALWRDEAGLSDGQLLDLYVRSREEAAFASLVQRHGPMVWGVCRRILGNERDAEDAFQATFLVLIRKAASVVPREQIANWLYGVARQTARKARAMAVKRSVREKQVKDMPEPAIPQQRDLDDLLSFLDQELNCLSVKYRTPIVLCELEGMSYKEAARQLGCPEGTLAARLTRGRTMLAKRLSRHGLAVTAGTLAAGLSQSGSACVPASVVSSTIQAASLFAAGKVATGAISMNVAALTEGVLKTMLMTKLKITTAVLLTAAALSGAAGLVYQTQAGEKAPKAEARTAAPAKAGAAENILQNHGFEEGGKSPAHWSQGAKIDGVQYIWDKKIGQQGKASICLHKTAQRYFPIAQWYQVVDRKGDKPALRVVAQVKAQGVTKAIIDVIFLDEKGKWIEHKWAAYIGAKKAEDPPVSHDWKEYTGRVEIPQTAKKIQIALQIYGPGKVWFDNVRAEYDAGRPAKGGAAAKERETQEQPLPPDTVKATSQTNPVKPPKENKSELQENRRPLAEDTKDDLKRLNGSWKVVALEADGRKAPTLALEGMRWSFKGSEVQMDDPGEKSGGEKSSVKLDSSKTPKHIDLVVVEGPRKDKTLQGIFTLEKDRLVICLRGLEAAEKGRPKEFKTEAGSGLGMIALERVSTSKKDESKPAGPKMFEVKLDYFRFAVRDNKPSSIGISTDRYYAELDDRGRPRTPLPLAENVEVWIDGKKAKITDLLPGDKIALQLACGEKRVTKIELNLKTRLGALEKEAEALRKRIKQLEEVK